jgi:NAD(P)-dependent dehydrogenase (short-subunit alcohol dehydrogenase family)
MRLRDRVAIITGSARGIGRAVALGFAREGARVVIADVRHELAQATADEVRAVGSQAHVVAVDVADVGRLDRLVDATLKTFGRIDILHNNAGVLGRPRDFFDHTPDDWELIVGVNLRSAFFLTQKVARVMIDQGSGGKILNTASTSGFIASSTPIVAYDVSKAGLRQLTVSLAAHLAPYRINVNAIAPGTIDTELTGAVAGGGDAQAEWLERRVRDKVPWGRVGQPQDLVGAAVFLCSDEADYVTGHTLVVDGGVLAV